MSLGWPLTILLVLAIAAIVVGYHRGDRNFQRRKLEIVQRRLAALEARKLREARGEAAPDSVASEEKAGYRESGDQSREQPGSASDDDAAGKR